MACSEVGGTLEEARTGLAEGLVGRRKKRFCQGQCQDFQFKELGEWEIVLSGEEGNSPDLAVEGQRGFGPGEDDNKGP